ncbi:MAG: aldehyde ferredoxin oxidoreductase family protein [Candidatus Bathyarchaeia archaeon]
MVHGYAGFLLFIDLTTGKVERRELRENIRNMFIGGKGFVAKLLYDLLPPNTDPFSPENPLIFAAGPLNGTIPPFGNKNIVGGKSPLTGLYMDSYFSGGFGAELKFAGYDALVIKGRSQRPVYIIIDDNETKILDATHVWGKTTYETYNILKKDHGDPTVKVVCIGPAGENMVRFACIDADIHRQAGRCGGGAIMGSKNLKAIVVRGSGEIEVAQVDKLIDLAKEFSEVLRKTPDASGYSEYGTSIAVSYANVEGLWPYKNWQDQVYDEAVNEYSGEEQKKRVWIKDRSGYGCTMLCEKVAMITRGPFAGKVVHGAEYETVAMLGANCGFSNLNALLQANLLCDLLGIDTISMGAVASFAMECYERGILTREDLGGLDLKFGNYDALNKLIEMVAYRKGIGKILAEGVRIASQKIGKGSEHYAIEIKGLETPAWGVRGAPAMALQYVTVDRGGCHQRGWPIVYETAGTGPEGQKIERLSTEGKAACCKWDQDYTSAMGTLIQCDLTRFGVDPSYFTRALSYAIGYEVTFKDFMVIGERIWNLIRLINLREGLTREMEEKLPTRFMEEPLPSGPAKGHYMSKEELRKMLNEYYRIRGWDDKGEPRKEKLVELGLER